MSLEIMTGNLVEDRSALVCQETYLWRKELIISDQIPPHQKKIGMNSLSSKHHHNEAINKSGSSSGQRSPFSAQIRVGPGASKEVVPWMEEVKGG